MKDISLQDALEQLYRQQLDVWPLCRDNYEALKKTEVRALEVDGREFRLQCNPARLSSASAAVREGVVQRPCFLCRSLRPASQLFLNYTDAVSGRRYELLVNPYPVVDRHFTIVAEEHAPQSLSGRVEDMARLAGALPDYLVFFNGARSGASAPDHMHFQAVPKCRVPLLSWSTEQQVLWGVVAGTPEIGDSDLLNVACWAASDAADSGGLHWLTVRRALHRPWQYFATGEEHCLISPATLEFCGLVPLAVPGDFRKMDAALLADVLRQVARREPVLRVGIMEGPAIDFSVGGIRYHAVYRGESLVEVDGRPGEQFWTLHAPFTLHGVTIGKQFHWEKTEDQTFGGALRIIAREGRLHAINYVAVEDYLLSVIASEMSALNNLELLKTHAVISRSWVLRQIDRTETSSAAAEVASPAAEDENRLIRWFDHDDHTLYDVCADDHCQRYQGLSRVVSADVARAIGETRGEVLTDAEGRVCDARFSKCCGGVSEAFEVCWQDVPHDYLRPVVDAPANGKSPDVGALSLETEAGVRRWIESGSTSSFCNTEDERVLHQVLNDYDRSTHDFYRWEVIYGQAGLSALLERKTGLSVGRILHLRPLKRGRSGRICELEIEGDCRTVVIGKELMIRMALSETHLYSSAFVVDEEISSGGELRFRIKGAGWGHGVGLCQIGAACMSLRGYGYREILDHYFVNTRTESIY